MGNIDWDYIGKLEGTRSDGYVPVNTDGTVVGNSGVTFGTGVDLGSKNDAYFAGLPETLVAKLRPYYGKKGAAALTYITANPQVLTDPEVKALNEHAKTIEVNLLKNRWTRDTGLNFDDLPSNMATAIASVSFQYGAAEPKDKKKGYPKFWEAATNRDIDAMEKELRDFKDAHPSRREADADRLVMEQKSRRIRSSRPDLVSYLNQVEKDQNAYLSNLWPVGEEEVQLPPLASDLVDQGRIQIPELEEAYDSSQLPSLASDLVRATPVMEPRQAQPKQKPTPPQDAPDNYIPGFLEAMNRALGLK